MVKRSLKASKEGIIQAKKSFERRQWSQEYLAAEVGLSTRNSIWKFFSGRPIDRHIFMEICFKLDLEWEEIADLPKFSDDEPIEQNNADKNINDNSLSLDGNIEYLRKKLQGQIKHQCSNIQVNFAFNQQLPLESIYVETKALTTIHSQRWLDISDFPQPFSQLTNNNSFSSEQIINAIEVAHDHQRLIIMGKPGSGKSTFLKYLTLLCLQNKFKNQCLPILISGKILALQNTSINPINLIDYIKETWKVLGISAQEVEQLAVQGKLVILIDDLETVSAQNSQSIFAAIEQFTSVYYQCTLVLSCRVGTAINILSGFYCIELADFDEQQVENFVSKWFNTNTSLFKSELKNQDRQFLELLNRPENQLVKELTKTPLLLSLLCSVFQERNQFPAKMSKLYQEALEILSRQNDFISSISTASESTHLPFNHKIAILSQIANNAFNDEIFYYEKQQLIDIIISYLKTLNYQVEEWFVYGDRILQSLVRENGLLVEQAKGIYAFSHLAFQDFLTARTIVYNLDQSQQEYELQKLASKIFNPQWRATILLTLEMLPNSNLLIHKIQAQINNFIKNNDKFENFFATLIAKEKSLKINIQPEAIVNFYLGLIVIKDLNLAIALDVKIGSELPHELALDTALIRVLTLAEKIINTEKLEDLLELGFALDIEKKFTIDQLLQDQLNDLKNLMLSQAENGSNLLQWWQNNASHWITQLRNLIIEHRLIGHKWQFDQQELQQLQNYYDSYLFLVNCINHLK